MTNEQMIKLAGLEYGAEIDAIADTFQGKNVKIIGLIDAFSTSLKNPTYLEYLVKSINFSEINLKVWNATFPQNLKEHHIREMLQANISLADIKRIQNFDLPFSHSKTISKEDEKIGLRSFLTEKGDVNIFYSSGFEEMPSRKELPKIQKKEMEVRKENLDAILSLNPSATIYQLGFPLTQNNVELNQYLEEENNQLKILSLDFGICFVDLSSVLCRVKRNKKLVLVEDQQRFIAIACMEKMYRRRVLKERGKLYEAKERIPVLNDSSIHFLNYYNAVRINHILNQLEANVNGCALSTLEEKYLQEELKTLENLGKRYRKIEKKKCRM